MSSLITRQISMARIKALRAHWLFRPPTHEQFLDQECHNSVAPMFERVGLEPRHLR